MTVSFHEAKAEIERLVERFARNLDTYKRAEYKETQVRVEFIDPFFETLGWDVRNVRGYAEQYKDVVHEDAIKVSGMTRAPDYCFRIGGVRKFFLEAKRPSVSVQEDIGPAYQLRRYAWSAKLPLSILTDFEEFSVYDCRQRPKPNDKASVGRITYLTFDQYLDCLDDIYAVFAKESVLKGSFDRYVQDTKRKRGTSEVDAEFLKEIEGWRETLARNIALRNPDLSVHELNFGVQRTIDRIIFLRMCEDRGIEGYGRLLALTGGPHIYPRLGDLYRQADEKYDSELFDFQADTLSKTLSIDDKVLQPILAGLYYPQSPYEFSVLPAEILGQVYEQFLGKVIRLTPGHRAKVEEKPEVKKAGGVYYTPTYIVDYIVQQTVGKLVEGKTPRQISKLRVLDPACGSGSFLLGAYQYLLDYHRQWYEAHDPAKHARGKQPALSLSKGPALYQAPSPAGGGGVGEGAWRLTTAEKKRILLNNIYGVDIDRQAVEVTKLSLLLQVLEGESQETLGQQLMLWRERALPDLGDNIKCGNSLIGPDYFEAQLLPDEEEIRRVNPFDWEAGFPEIMAVGGFDAVIGNPPYIRIQTMKTWAPTEVEFYKQHYKAASKGNYDIYVVFVEKGLQLLNAKGRIGFIVPHRFFKTDYGEPLRKLLLNQRSVDHVFDFDGYMVFSQASINTCVLLLTHGSEDTTSFTYEKLRDPHISSPEIVMAKSADTLTPEIERLEVSYETLSNEYWNFIDTRELDLWHKVNAQKTRELTEFARIFVGLQTSMDKVFVLELEEMDESFTSAKSRMDGQTYKIETSICRPYIARVGVERYKLPNAGLVLLFPYDPHNDFRLFNIQQLTSQFPNALAYLKKFERNLRMREKGKFDDSEWYRYGRKQSIALFDEPKLIVQVISSFNRFCFDKAKTYFSGGGNGPYYGLRPDNSSMNILYFAGILNSKLLNWIHHKTSLRCFETAYSYGKRFIEKLPIHTINFNDPTDMARHDKMVALVERMLALHKKLAAATIPADKELHQRQIEATDRQIDALVYELYGLTGEEIAVVEGRLNHE